MNTKWSLPEADTYFAGMLTAEGFEIDKLERALGHCHRWRTAVDGGAHIGTWSAYLARRFSTVLAFEPAPDAFECLIQNTAGLDNVVALRMALGLVPGRAGITDDPARPGNTGSR